MRAAPTFIRLLAPTLTALRYDAHLTQPAPRTEAAGWFTTHVPAATTMALQPLFDRYFDTAPTMTTSQLTKLEGEIPANETAALAHGARAVARFTSADAPDAALYPVSGSTITIYQVSGPLA